MLSRIMKQLATVAGFDPVPLPWRKLQTVTQPQNIILMSLDGTSGTPAPVSVLRDRLAADLSRRVVPEVLYAKPSYTMYIDTIERTSYVRIYSWEVGGSRPWLAVEKEKVRELCGALVFVVDVADKDRLVEALEEYRCFLHQCPLQSPSMVLAVNGSTAQLEACFNTIKWGTRSVYFAAIDLETAVGIPEACAWLVDAILSTACRLEYGSAGR